MDRNLEYSQKLLEEFEALCKENEITYKLEWGPSIIGSGVVMPVSSARKLIETVNVKSNPDRIVESWGNSSAYPDTTLRYVGLDSTCFNILDYTNYKYHGIFIEIKLVRKKEKSISDSIPNAIEWGLLNDVYQYKKKPVSGKKSAIKQKIYKKSLSKAKDGGELRKKAFERVMASDDADFTGFANLEPTENSKKYPKGYIDLCIVDADLDSRDYFCEDNEVLTELSGAQLDEARRRRDGLEKAYKANSSNFKTARESWETVQNVHAKLTQSEDEGDE